MVEKKSIEKDFSFLFEKKEVLAVLLYGSVVKGNETPRSDIDICVVAPECKDRAGLLREVYGNLDVYAKKYDIRIFEELPLYIKIHIILDHDVIHAKDIYDLYEYFYYFRKLWDDQAPRQHITKEELAMMLE